MFGFFDDFFRDFNDRRRLGYEKLTEEVVQFTKGDYKTTIILKFDKNGLLVTHSAISEYVQSESMKYLKEELSLAIEEENFEKAAEIQKKINKVREADEQKPTL